MKCKILMFVWITLAVLGSGCTLHRKNRVFFSPVEAGRSGMANCHMRLGVKDPQTAKKYNIITTWVQYRDGGNSLKVTSLAQKPYESCNEFFGRVAKTAKAKPKPSSAVQAERGEKKTGKDQ